eukprot:1205535-Pleurochrysis_carterae.AAC.1
MDVGRTRCRKLARVVRVESAHDLTRLVSVLVDERSEGSDEALDVRGRLRLSLHWVGGLEARMVVDENQDVLIVAVLRAHE